MTDIGIHQVLVSASPGDAITNFARWLQGVLRATGPSDIFALHIDPALRREVKSLHEYRARHSRSVLIFHSSIGEPAVHAFLESRREPLVLMYHNITPAEYFEPYDVAFAELLALGRRELASLRPRVACAVAASAFNARELEAMGYRDVKVVPPLGNIHRLISCEPDPSTTAWLERLDAPIVLNVAQLMPHKRPDFLVEALYLGQTYQRLRGSFLLVGHHRLVHYARGIEEQVHELNVECVHIPGAVGDAALAAMFRAASLVVSTSEHEGFCVPLIEAMTFGAPVLARACAAIPETVDDAGMLLPATAGPALFAEAITELLSNDRVRSHLGRRGKERASEFESHRSDVAMLDALLEVA